MLSKDTLSLLDIQASIEKISKYTFTIHSADELEQSEMNYDACLIHLINIGEMVGRLSEEFTTRHHAIEWHKIRALRNIIAHDYFGVDLDEIWSVLITKLPELRDYINSLRII
jgi:uncharacterized protein with HEPN domain